MEDVEKKIHTSVELKLVKVPPVTKSAWNHRASTGAGHPPPQFHPHQKHLTAA